MSGFDPNPDSTAHDGIAQALRRAAVSTYRTGWLDGATELLDHLQGRAGASLDGAYRGPMPPELRDWLAEIRSGVEACRPPSAGSGEDEPA